MSIHWNQEQATVYPVLVLQKVGGILREDHFTFRSNDLTHDVPFVKLCNAMIHTYYDERDVNIEIDIEFNDLLASSNLQPYLLNKPLKTKNVQRIRNCVLKRNLYL